MNRPRQTDAYFARFGFCGRQIVTPAVPGLALIVVIPCFNEPNLLASLESLRQSEPPTAPFEVIVVVNCASNADGAIVTQNRRTLRDAQEWIASQAEPRLIVHLIEALDLPPRHAGVGLARKIGMDEALRRFGDSGNLERGVIVCFDADATCAPNYLRSIETHFAEHPRTPGCSIYFEHPLDGDLPKEIYEAAAAYELHLRHYVRALRYAGFPHAYHTIGSSMAVRARAYMEQGGMNRRKAGEDFYFLHKLIPLGGFTELTTTAVYPSPRPSDRVPFGTGRAVTEWLRERKSVTYPWRAFEDLRTFLGQVPRLFETDAGPLWPETVKRFMSYQGVDEALAEIRQHTSSRDSFVRRFFRWFDGFRAMKFIHFARDEFYGEERVEEAAQALLRALNVCSSKHTIREILYCLRDLDRG